MVSPRAYSRLVTMQTAQRLMCSSGLALRVYIYMSCVFNEDLVSAVRSLNAAALSSNSSNSRLFRASVL